MQIINAHIHTFRGVDVPENLFPLGLAKWLARRDRKFLTWLVHNLDPFTDNDIFDYYLNFIKTGKMKSQLDIYNKVSSNYPTGTRFIVLPMDMAYMGAGKVPRNYKDQLDELATLPVEVIKYIHVDPRRPDVQNMVEYYQSKGFRGIKLYPPLGYYPDDEILMNIYSFCNKKKMSVVGHGSPRNPIHFKGSFNELLALLKMPKTWNACGMDKKDLCAIFTHPLNYAPALRSFPNVNFCIAHFGSAYYWDKYLKGEKEDNWIGIIIDMINKYDNFWTDISFTMGNEKYWPLLRLLLIDNPKLASRVLFGSDFYMNEVEGSEMQWSIKLRTFLGEDLFKQIAEVNPRVFLKE